MHMIVMSAKRHRRVYIRQNARDVAKMELCRFISDVMTLPVVSDRREDPMRLDAG